MKLFLDILVAALFAGSMLVLIGYCWGRGDAESDQPDDAYARGVERGRFLERRSWERKVYRNDWWGEGENVAALERQNAGQTHRGDL